MAVMISVKAGHDPAYYTATVGSGKQADYYLSATRVQGEPQGTWVGEGLADLAIHDGDVVNEDDFLAIYGEFVNPRNGEHLGRPPRQDAELRKLFEQKKAAEPGLTREREHELWIEARSEVKSAGVMYFDTVFTPDKSVSLAHTTALASAEQARQAGDLGKAAEWEARAASIWEEIEKACRVWIDYAQEEARFVRTGHHGRRIEGVEQGKFEDSHEIPVAMFPHHCSREGDPNLHLHVLWLNKVKTISDDAWRAIESRQLFRVRGAGSAIGALTLETGLAERHGFDWVYRPKSHGRVIKGCSEKAINAFSSRRAQITKTVLGMADEYKAQHGCEPSRRALWSMAQHANRLTRKGKSEKLLDRAQLLKDWETVSREAELGSLAELAGSLWAARAEARIRSAGELTPAQERELMLKALADAQASSAAWGRQVLIHRLGENLPDHVTAAGSEHAARVLEGLADRIMAGEGGDRVHCLTAGEFPRVPDYLRRASGESLFRPHGSELYATKAQLTLEQRIIAQAGAEKAPHLEPELAAELVGVELADLEAQLRSAATAQDFTTGSGLSASQAAVAFNALTSARRAEIGVAIAGSGKSYLAGKAAEAWVRAGKGRVIGTATSSNARNVLAASSPVIEGFNLSELLGDLPDQPEARGWVDVGDGALIILDEASLTSMRHWGSLLDMAERFNAKLLVLGDTHQIDSPEAGGGLQMLARKLGFAQLQEVHRFRDQWQKAASVQLRAGDVHALVAYDEHGLLHGGSYEEMADAASRAYLADLLAGKDTLLLAQTNEESRDLSRRVQSFMREWGKLGRTSVELREGQRAWTGDLITARHNEGSLINSDRLRLVDVEEAQALVSRRIEQADGSVTWSDPFAVPIEYVRQHADLGYAQTWTTSQGRTVADSAHSLVASNAGRNGFYESMTRSKIENHAWLYEREEDFPEVTADPELERERVRQAERQGEVVERHESADAVALATRVVQRMDEPMSATETRERSLSSADHLGHLWSIWDDQYRAAGARRYEAELRALIGDDLTGEVLKDTDDLYRALRHCELAGKDTGDVLADAINGRSFEGARSVSAVLAARVRQATEEIPAQLRESWAELVPATGDAERRDFLVRVAEAMDARQARLGAHVADTAPVWAVQALGEVPADQAERDAWEKAVGEIAAYREMTGWDHPGQALGPQPGSTSPEFRAEWQNAISVMAKVDGVDVRGMSDGLLLTRRSAYERETTWAPASVTDELRVIRLTGLEARTEAARCAEDAAAAKQAGREEWAKLHESRAADRQAVEERCLGLVATLEPAQQTRAEWETLTADTRRVALAADLELKRRGVVGPNAQMDLREPEGLVPGDISDEGREATVRAALGLDSASQEATAKVEELAEHSRITQARIDEIKSMQEPDLDEDLTPGQAWATMLGREREAIIQPPEVLVTPSPDAEVDEIGYDLGIER